MVPKRASASATPRVLPYTPHEEAPMWKSWNDSSFHHTFAGVS